MAAASSTDRRFFEDFLTFFQKVIYALERVVKLIFIFVVFVLLLGSDWFGVDVNQLSCWSFWFFIC